MPWETKAESTEVSRRKFDLEERLLKYAASIIRLVDGLRPSPAGRHVGGQLLRSGTNPLSSHGEAQSAESVKDFVHKLRIGLKELRESSRALKLIQMTQLHKDGKFVAEVLDETDQLARIFNSSVQTASRRLVKES